MDRKDTSYHHHAKSVDDMRTAYSFTDYQNSALDEILADRVALASLAKSLSITSADVLVIDRPCRTIPARSARRWWKRCYPWWARSTILGAAKAM